MPLQKAFQPYYCMIGNKTSASNSSKKALGMLGVNYCFVKYSQIEALKQKSNAASLALSHLAKSCVDIKLMCLRPEAREKSLQKLMDMSDTKPSTPLLNKSFVLDVSKKDMVKRLKSTGLRSPGSQNGRKKKSQKRCI